MLTSLASGGNRPDWLGKVMLTSLVSGGNTPDWLGGVELTSLASAGGNRPDWHANNRLEIKDKPDWLGVHVDQTG